MRLALALAAVTCVLARAEFAEACSCGMPSVSISPDGADAPTNATVMVWIPAFVTKLDDGNVSQPTITLRKKAGAQIATNYVRTGSGKVSVVEMLPRQKLADNTEYEVVMVKGGGAPQVVGSFTTGTRTLSAAPEFKGFLDTGYYKDKVVCCMCRTGEPYIRLMLADNIDDAKRSQVRFAIWAAGADGKLDYTKAPVTYEPGWSSVTLGNPSICGSANFSIPKQKSLRLGVKLIDLAGNASKPAEVTVDLTKTIDPDAGKPSR